MALLAVGAWVYWLATGVMDAARVVQDRAAVAQAELEAFRDTLKAGDEVTAANHLDAAAAALGEAKAAAQASEVRTAAGLPYVGRTVQDLDLLLAAAQIMTRSGTGALEIYENFSGEDSKLFSDGQFSIPAIRDAQEAVAGIQVSMDRAEARLLQVDGDGPKGAEVLEKKASGLDQIRSLRDEIVSLRPLLDSLPSAVGADGKKTYLVAIMNPAEMRASGGAPLGVVFVHFKDGRMKIGTKGQTSQLTDMNSEFYWNRLTGEKDPFALAKGEAERFVNTTFNPDFRTSGEQLVRATKANFAIRTDGVIALDITAIGALLDYTGPIKTEFYGNLTGRNITRKLVVKAYTFGSDDAALGRRYDVNEQLMTIMLERLTQGGGLIGKAEALGQAVPGRHLQMYFRDPKLQRVVVDKGLGGSIPAPKWGNLTAVYTQNGNGNKMDVFQERLVTELVRLKEDGSAVVKRTVRLENPTPPYSAPFPDRRRGYDTRWATNLVINLMPPGARVTKQPVVSLLGTLKTGVDQDGRTFANGAVVMPPDSRSTLTWTYQVENAAQVGRDRMVLRNWVAPQSMIRTPELKLVVVPPDGWAAVAKNTWQVRDDGRAVKAEAMDRTYLMRLSLRRS